MSALTVEHSLGVLLRRRGIVAIGTLLVTATALGMALLHRPVYTARAEVVIQPVTADPLATTRMAPRVDPLRDIQTEADLMGSRTIQQTVAETLKVGNPPPVSAVPLVNADAVSLSVKSGDARRSALFANAYANAYLRFKESKIHEAFLVATQVVETRISELQRQIDTDEATVVSHPESSRGTVADRDALIVQVGLLKQLLDRTQLRARLASAGAFLAAPATTPSVPTSPKPLRSGAVGLAFGLFLGVGLAFFVESLDASVRSVEDIGLIAPEVSTLGIIPLVPGRGRRRPWHRQSRPPGSEEIDAAFASIDSPGSPTAEGFRGLRTSIEFLALDRPLGIVVVSSPGRGEGRTTTVVNLAVLLARAGARVCVVSAGERGAAEILLPWSAEVGLVDVVLGDVPLSTAVQAIPAVDNLYVLPSGRIRVDRSAFLTLPRTGGVLAGLRCGFDLVVVDAPPLLAGADPAALLPWIDGVVLVVRVARTARADLARAVELLDGAAASLLGVVVNAVTANDRGRSPSSGPNIDARRPVRRTRETPSKPEGPDRPPAPGGSSVSVRARG